MSYFRLLLICLVALTHIRVAQAGAKCPLPWNANASLPNGMDMSAVCPHGTLIKLIDVTLPNDRTLVNWICVVYGIIPFAVIGLAVIDAIVWACLRRGLGTRSLVFLLFVAFQVALGELVFKRIVKQPRPAESCNHSCGMPSSHATMSIGFFVLMFLDAVYRVMPFRPDNVAEARVYSEAIRNRAAVCGCSLRDFSVGLCRTGFNVIPLADVHTLSACDCITFTLLWGALLLPVAFSRVVLKDHSPAQVMMGAVIGVFEALAYFTLLRQCLMKKYNRKLGSRCACIFVHDYAQPVYEVISTSYCLLSEAQDYQTEGYEGLIDEDEVLQALIDMHSQVNWYLTQLDPCCEAFTFDEDKPIIAFQEELLLRLRGQIVAQVTALSAEAGMKLQQSDEEIE